MVATLSGTEVLLADKEKLVQGTVGHSLVVQVDGDWSELTVVATFASSDAKGHGKVDAAVVDGQVVIPVAVLSEAGVHIGVVFRGTNSSGMVKKTTICDLGVVCPSFEPAGLTEGEQPEDWMGQIRALVDEARAIAQSVRDDADRGAFDGQPSPDIATMLKAFPVGHASGPVANFDDGADGLPVKCLTVNVEPVQAGSGDPSPDNERPITGWTGAAVTRCGKNRIAGLKLDSDGTHTIRYYGSQGGYPRLTTPHLTAGTYTLSMRARAGRLDAAEQIKLWYQKKDGTVVGGYGGWKSFGKATLSSEFEPIACTFTLPEDAEAICLGYYSSGNYVFFDPKSIQLERGDTATDYESYQGDIYSITFPAAAGTVYGGTLDVTTGLLTVDRGMVVLDGSEKWNAFSGYSGRFYNNSALPASASGLIAAEWLAYGGAIGSSTSATGENYCYYQEYSGKRIVVNVTEETVDAWKEKLAAAPLRVLYAIATPTTYQLTPQEITTLLGQNNIWADTGDVDIEYYQDITTVINKLKEGG